MQVPTRWTSASSAMKGAGTRGHGSTNSKQENPTAAAVKPQKADHVLIDSAKTRVEFRKFGNTTIFEMLLASTNPATSKFEMDCGWTSAAGYNPAMFLNKYPDRISMLHIKAFQAGPSNLNLVGPNEPKPTELGRGKPDYKPIFCRSCQSTGRAILYRAGTCIHENVRTSGSQSQLQLFARDAILDPHFECEPFGPSTANVTAIDQLFSGLSLVELVGHPETV